VSEPKVIVSETTSQAAAYAINLRGRPSQLPSPNAVPDQTALHGAAQRGLTPIVTFLVEHGADLQARDANDRTALDLARGVGVRGVRQAQGEGHPETAAALEKLMLAKGLTPPRAD
jgi:hypothetical protein